MNVIVDQVVVHPSGQSTPWRTVTAEVHLTRTDGGWRVDSYTEIGSPR